MSDYDHLSRKELIERLKMSEESDAYGKKIVDEVNTEDIHKMLFTHMTEEVHLWKLVRDDSGNIINWELVDVNPAAARSWSMSREEVIGKSADEIFTTAIDLFMPIVNKIFTEREPYSWEMYFPDINQNMKMTSVSVGEYFITTGSDITSIKKSQEKASIFESFVQNSTDFVGIADEKGVPVYLNKAGRDMIGLSPDYPIENLSIPECYPESEREFVENVILREMNEKGYWSGETYFRNFKTNEPIPVSDTHFRIQNPNDKTIIGFGTITRDIRKIKDMEKRLRAAKNEAEQANKAKSEFLALMSHELRTPLNAILGFSEIMKDEMLGGLGNETYRQYAADIYASGAHLTDLINSILDLAKIEAGRRDLVVDSLDAGEMVAATLRLLEEQANNAGLILERSVAPDLPPLMADRLAVRQILFNVLSNAIKYTPRGGRVTIAAKQCGQGGIAISVADTGIGISEEDQARLFEPFTRAEDIERRQFEGTGLGLTVVKSLMELHGGTVRVDSALGEGSVFSLRFPAPA